MRKKLFALLIVAIIAALLLTACAGVDITLTFEVDGETYATVSTMGQEAVRMPKDPVKEGYVFDGWYWDKDIWEQPFTANSLLDTPLSENMTVYAKWKGKAEEHVHTFGEWTEVTAATCTTEGTEKRVCSACGEEETRTIEKLPHTCQWETDGTTLRGKCEICGEEVIREDTLMYELNANGTEYCVRGVQEGSTPTDVIIPVKNNGKPITSIGDSAFSLCYSLESIEIPKSVTSIGSDAFFNCSNLTSVEIPNSVTSIGDSAFTLCYSLESVEIPNSVTSIGDSAFYGCISLESVEIPASVTSIGEKAFKDTGIWNNAADNSVVYADKWAVGYKGTITNVTLLADTVGISSEAFSGCSSLKSVEIADSVTIIGDYAFFGCDAIESLTCPTIAISDIPQSNLKTLVLTSGDSIGSSAFSGCSSLVSVEIPNSVTSIGSGAFSGCSSLVSVKIPNSVTSIGSNTFYRCSSLVSVEIPNTVTSIGNYAFCGCSSLTSIEIPDSVTSIGSQAFSGCSSLVSIEIPDSVTSIGSQAFYRCSSLVSVEIQNSVTSIGDYAFRECSSLTSVVIGNGVTSIGDYAFYYCSSLVSVEIPASVTSIGERAFSSCDSLTNVNYGGTKAEWKAIEKGYGWNELTGNYTVTCTDGTLT